MGEFKLVVASIGECRTHLRLGQVPVFFQFFHDAWPDDGPDDGSPSHQVTTVGSVWRTIVWELVRA